MHFTSKGYRLNNASTGKIQISKDVLFDESSFHRPKKSTIVLHGYDKDIVTEKLNDELLEGNEEHEVDEEMEDSSSNKDVSMNVNHSKSDGKNVDVNDVYMTHMKRLNEDVCEWIKKHISQNPYVDLSPVFKDHEKHLSTLEKKYRSYSVDDCDNKTMATAFTFPTSISTAASVNSSVFTSTYGSSNLSPATSIPSVNNTTEPEDEPKTQSQIKSLREEDAFFSLRCKLFFKKTDDWSELGVGMLSLKKIDEKIQVIIRNDTALGKIILNVIINESTPMSRSGKNNVLLLSVPNPPVFSNPSDNSKPVSYLIRVKSAENAEELLTKMKPL
ncbi:LOW QUALITY PROTEIN: nuclear pore complex protein Nup50-like [Xenia sp. Carnegie-2017]|uniref:LOW QUALITY PROTEIN: nuclear pore complex protein Nup50-like n=1 Tax=Xenia sp. Carnegie-2017 TaxID=2897299 RepID=UPI001F04B701|nr:LOW QUALITY PROTEIN: nuclear pore complex protein Nup50-like [Xenia sp. Carnegie-2017]